MQAATRPTRLSPLIIACLGATWFVWGSTYLAIKFSLISFPPFVGMGTRLLAAGMLLLAWAWWHDQKMPTPVEWRNGLVLGALMLGGSVGGSAYAEQTVASGLVVAFIAITPAVLAILSLPFGIRPSRLELIGITLGIAGTAMLGSGAGFSSSPAGLTSMTIAILLWSLGSVLSQHALPLARGTVGFSSQLIGGGIALMCLSLAAGETLRWPPEPLAVAAWLYLVFFGSLIAFTAYMVLLSTTSTTLAASYTLVNPVIAMFLGVLLGRETVTPYEWIATAIIIAGVTVISLGKSVRTELVTVKADAARSTPER